MNHPLTLKHALLALSLAGLLAWPAAVRADEEDHHAEAASAATVTTTTATAAGGATRSTPGRNEWNRGREPQDWWGEIVRYHGHMGPWNVLGWRIGRAALRELGAAWGEHTLEVVCHIPLAMPYSCLADGLTVATGNSIGRLDIRLAEELSTATLHVSVRRKDRRGPVLEFWPARAYVRQIETQPASQLEALSKKSATLPEAELFTLRRLP